MVDEGLKITSNARLVLITGNPGAWKSTVAKLIYGAQEPEWRMLSLDDYFYLQNVGTVGADGWDRFEANAEVRGAIIQYIGDREGRVIAEGIIQTDREIDVYRRAMKIPVGDPALRLFELRCTRETAADRMFNRKVKERAQATWAREQYAGHYDWLSRKLRASSAERVDTEGSTPEKAAQEIVDKVNGR